MIKYYSILLLLCMYACNHPAKVSMPPVPNKTIEKTDAGLKNANGTWMYHGNKYSGYIIEKDSAVVTVKMPVVDGKEDGTTLAYYKNGQTKSEREFVNGNRHGHHKGWYENGQLAFEYYFENDKYEGAQKTYYKNGKPWQLLNYLHGYEEGQQKAWAEDGRVINNFTVKNGKLYGVVGRYDCMSVAKK